MSLTGRQRLLLVASAAWVIAVYFLVDPYEDKFPRGAWKAFLLIGIGPIAVAAATLWVRAGFNQDQEHLGELDETTRTLIAKRLEIGVQVLVKGYHYNSARAEHVFAISRKAEVGQLVLGREVVSTHTVAGIVQRLASPEVEHQFDTFHNKRLILSGTGIRIEIGSGQSAA